MKSYTSDAKKFITDVSLPKTGAIDLDSWENNISTVKERKVYSVNLAQVRQWMDQNKLSTVFSLALTLDSRADTQASAKMHDQNDTTTNITFVKIHSVEKLERFLKCVKWAKKAVSGNLFFVASRRPLRFPKLENKNITMLLCFPG